MDVPHRPVIPPAPKVHRRDLPPWRVLFEIGRSSIGVWPERAFDDLFSRTHAFGIDSALISDPADVRHVLGANARNYHRPVAFYRITRPLAGAGLLLAEGEAWRRQRRMLAPAFTPASVGLLLPHFIAAGEGMATRLAATPRANLSAGFHEATLDAVLRALFSLPVSAERDRFATLVRAYIGGAGRPNPFDGFARSEDAFAFSTAARRRFERERVAAVGALIEGRRAEIHAGRVGEAKDLLDLLLAARDPETGPPLSDVEIGDQAATMLFAGFETTSRLLFWASYLLALDPVEQARLRREVQAFPPERIGSLEDLQHWPRLRNALLEALRLYPPAPNVIRQSLAEDVLAGQTMPAATQVWISPWVIHRHRKLWDQPTAFVPDRFAGIASPWVSLEAFMPFGAGPRICIGASFAMAEAQIMLASLLARFSFSLESDRPVIPTASLTIAPAREPWFRLEPVG